MCEHLQGLILQVTRLEVWIQPGDEHLCLHGNSLLFYLLVCFLLVKLSKSQESVAVDDPVTSLLTGYCTSWTLLQDASWFPTGYLPDLSCMFFSVNEL